MNKLKEVLHEVLLISTLRVPLFFLLKNIIINIISTNKTKEELEATETKCKHLILSIEAAKSQQENLLVKQEECKSALNGLKKVQENLKIL